MMRSVLKVLFLSFLFVQCYERMTTFDRMDESVVNQVLEEIVELGYIHIANGGIVHKIPPIENLYTGRWISTIQYLMDYTRYHRDFEGEFFLCTYDGWREYADPVAPDKRVYVPWFDIPKEERLEFYIGKGYAGETRFVPHHPRPEIYPELPLPILAYNRHIADRQVMIMPDGEFLENSQFHNFLVYVVRHDIGWDDKKPQMFWRGAGYNIPGYSYTVQGLEEELSVFNISRIHQRHLLNLIAESNYCEPDVRSILNSSFDQTPLEEFLQYKYLIDLDGFVAAWSALYWKLFSQSVVMKAPSHWEQWYYEDLIPFKHYIPLTSFHPRDIMSAYAWCETFTIQCQKIASDSSDVIRKLTYEYAVKDYIIH